MYTFIKRLNRFWVVLWLFIIGVSHFNIALNDLFYQNKLILNWASIFRLVLFFLFFYSALKYIRRIEFGFHNFVLVSIIGFYSWELLFASNLISYLVIEDINFKEFYDCLNILSYCLFNYFEDYEHIYIEDNSLKLFLGSFLLSSIIILIYLYLLLNIISKNYLKKKFLSFFKISFPLILLFILIHKVFNCSLIETYMGIDIPENNKNPSYKIIIYLKDVFLYKIDHLKQNPIIIWTLILETVFFNHLFYNILKKT